MKSLYRCALEQVCSRDFYRSHEILAKSIQVDYRSYHFELHKIKYRDTIERIGFHIKEISWYAMFGNGKNHMLNLFSVVNGIRGPRNLFKVFRKQGPGKLERLSLFPLNQTVLSSISFSFADNEPA